MNISLLHSLGVVRCASALHYVLLWGCLRHYCDRVRVQFALAAFVSTLATVAFDSHGASFTSASRETWNFIEARSCSLCRSAVPFLFFLNLHNGHRLA